MSIEANLEKPTEAVPVPETVETVVPSVVELRHSAKRYVAAGVAGLLVVGGAVAYSQYRSRAAESCRQSFDLPMDGSSEPVLKAPDGRRFKLRVGQQMNGDTTELGFLVYGPHEHPSMFDMFSGRAQMASIAPADIGTGPEATFVIDGRTELAVNVTDDVVETRCVTVAAVRS